MITGSPDALACALSLRDMLKGCSSAMSTQSFSSFPPSFSSFPELDDQASRAGPSTVPSPAHNYRRSNKNAHKDHDDKADNKQRNYHAARETEVKRDKHKEDSARRKVERKAYGAFDADQEARRSSKGHVNEEQTGSIWERPLYYSDRKGDPLNQTYGSLHAGDVPKYRLVNGAQLNDSFCGQLIMR